ncbi:MAG: SBBP repeat-containing protein [Verrucomicrobia subdivision 3 bacterium]|nr:SBBP repeat-containing protein [Limisphaerales bacterium]
MKPSRFTLLTGIAWIALSALTSRAYAQGGVPLWTNRYDGPGNNLDEAKAVVVDSIGNVFVTGHSLSETSDDYATIAYSSMGVPLWTNRYNGPGNGVDQPNALAVDSSGNVFVTGHASRTENSYAGVYATLAYSTAGMPLWTNLFNRPDNNHYFATAVAVDRSGNVFVTGNGYDLGTELSYPATLAYSGAGVPLWTNLWPEAGEARGVALDGSGNVIVYGGGTIAYSSVGVPLWTNRYRSGALAVDRNGNLFVTRGEYNNGSESDYSTIAYSSAGVPFWTNRYNGPANGYDTSEAIAVDGDGNVFVTGSSWGDFPSADDIVTIKYSNAGVSLWTNRYNGPGHSYDHARGIAVDRGGNVFVTGFTYDGGFGGVAMATVAYSSAGVPLWTNHFRGGQAAGIAVDNSGNAVVTGTSSGDYLTIKYSAIPPPIRLSIEPDSIGGYFLRFKGIPGSAYRLQRATSLTGLWTASAPQTASASGLVEFWDFFPPPGQAFYRVRAE